MADIIIFKGSGQYDALQYFADKLYEAFIEENINVKLLDLLENQLSVDDLEFLIKNERPKLFIGFNTNGFNIGETKYYKFFNVNHLAILIDHPIYHLNSLDFCANTLYISCVDEDRLSFLKNTKNYNRGFLLYHGVDSKIKFNAFDKENDMVFFGSLYDYEDKRAQWKNKYNDDIIKVLNTALEIGIYNSFMPVQDIMDLALRYCGYELHDYKQIEIGRLLITEIDGYLRNYHRHKFISNIKENKIVIHGNGCWDKYFNGCNNIDIRPEVKMNEAVNIMQKSKITINCTITGMYNGSHERPFMAAMAGSVVLSNYSPFYERVFGESAVLTSILDMNDIDNKINGILNDESLRMNMAYKARKNVAENHTWNSRVRQIMSMLD